MTIAEDIVDCWPRPGPELELDDALLRVFLESIVNLEATVSAEFCLVV
jgi:hypothetical protein